MDNNILDLIKLFSSNSTPKNIDQEIPKELKEQYPYGEFPIRYTKAGQEVLRKSSENRFSYEEKTEPKEQKENNFSFELLLPLIESLSNKKSNNMLEVMSKLLFKDNPEMAKLFKLLPQKKSGVEIKNTDNFPDTNKIKISSLKRIN
jgi:ATP-dependent RNA circularization protein (DNA/RNA ligase family)